MNAAAALGRLFVALPVPCPVSTQLARLQPPGDGGVRLVAAGDMHCTLHYLGTRSITETGDALRSVVAAPFDVKVAGLGCFSLRGGRRILWAGVEPGKPLQRLHIATAAALAAIGFEPERRTYRPHVTLARLAAEAPRGLAAAFTRAPESGPALAFACREFALYESRTEPEGARYRVLESFALRGA